MFKTYQTLKTLYTQLSGGSGDKAYVELPAGTTLYRLEQKDDIETSQSWFYFVESPITTIVKWKCVDKLITPETAHNWIVNVYQTKSNLRLLYLHEGYNEFDAAKQWGVEGEATDVGNLNNYSLASNVCDGFLGWASVKLIGADISGPTEIMLCSKEQLEKTKSISLLEFFEITREELPSFLRWLATS
jgi:hypothetical protein